MDSDALHLSGLPQAKDWISQFATHRPLQRSLGDAIKALWRWALNLVVARPRPRPRAHLPVWFFMLAANLVDDHARRAATEDPNEQTRIDRRIAFAVRRIDIESAAIVQKPAAEVGLGALVSQMARCWIGYAARPGDQTALTATLAAQRAYSDRVEQLAQLLSGGTW
ncbi:hypothetical protein [Nocardia xishanensis]|uniref:hypothetical protein n=1 Tax=Nocardia xishanensis TaxID=238964 RepID=UPI00082D7012|nr:hypothetical protein [Nocardia xishanensis]